MNKMDSDDKAIVWIIFIILLFAYLPLILAVIMFIFATI